MRPTLAEAKYSVATTVLTNSDQLTVLMIGVITALLV